MYDIAVHSGGYVGLTCAIHFAKAGKRVLCYDPDRTVVDGINSGTPKANEFLGYLGNTYPRENLQATNVFEETLACDVHFLAVPSEKDDEPWMSIVQSCLGMIARERAGKKTLVIIESTLQPGAVDSFIRANPSLISDTLEIAVCPRRDWFADAAKNLSSLPRVVGGYTPSATDWACDVLSAVTPREKLMPTSYRTAEVTKALENALFHAPIALCHSLALAYPELDIAEAARLAATHWRFESFGGLHLNLGTSGRCVPIGSKYLRDGAGDQVVDLLDSVLDTEDEMPEAVAQAITRRVVPNARILILGVAYRPGFHDAGMSGGLRVAGAFMSPVKIDFVDPVFADHEIVNLARDKYRVQNFEVVDVTALHEERLATYDAVILATPHAQFADLPDRFTRLGQVLFDARGAWQSRRQVFRERGILYLNVGSPGWR